MDENTERNNKGMNSQKNNLENYSLKSTEYSADCLQSELKTTNEEGAKEIVSFSVSQPTRDSKDINPNNNCFPYCIVWTPIPFLTYIIPSIGHTGIGNSTGIIHDFAGSFYVSIDDFAFGKPTKYVQLDLNEQEKYEYDRAIERGDNKYNMEEHNLCINNCHSHVAYVLNQIKYKGRNNYTMFDIWWMLIYKGKYISFISFIKTYIGFFIFILILWMLMPRK